MATLSATGGTEVPLGSNYLDNIVFKKRNPIILRSMCLLFGIIVYGCMVVDAWAWSYTSDNDGISKEKKCLYGEGSEGVCTFGIFVSFIGLLAAIIFLSGEFIIDKVALVHYRLQYYFVESIFSAIWTFLFLICFIMLETQWSGGEEADRTEIEAAGAGSSVRAAIWFSFLSIPIWASSAFMALQRYRVMRAELEYNAALAGRRPSSYPATITTTRPNNPTGQNLTTTTGASTSGNTTTITF
ncbi:synaptogyrin [Folsomia candida]|uniref:Synaptogyrin-2 n=1 Tax=Folsomia candida TaxID=158441 RepID=A0A226D0V1_FOLCA|nr:synaptogyrin [Folsomia candida]OXA39225.1 Synaptogyrin-2 [Folsomia candida]